MTNAIKTGIPEFDALFGDTEGFMGGRMYLIASSPHLVYPEIPLLGQVQGVVMKIDHGITGYLTIETWVDRVRKSAVSWMTPYIEADQLSISITKEKPVILVIDARSIPAENIKDKLREIRGLAVEHDIPVLVVDHPKSMFELTKWSSLKNLGRGFEAEFDGVFYFDQPEIRVVRAKLRGSETLGPVSTSFVGFGS